MAKKCTKNKHYPDWSEYSIASIGKNFLVLHANCQCWAKVYQRDYILNDEREIPVITLPNSKNMSRKQ